MPSLSQSAILYMRIKRHAVWRLIVTGRRLCGKELDAPLAHPRAEFRPAADRWGLSWLDPIAEETPMLPGLTALDKSYRFHVPIEEENHGQILSSLWG